MNLYECTERPNLQNLYKLVIPISPVYHTFYIYMGYNKDAEGEIRKLIFMVV